MIGITVFPRLGIKAGRIACQWLDPGNVYIVFLEKCPSNSTLYCPLDYQERVVDEMTLELLQRTCHLTSRAPLHSTANHCPNVSMAEFCSSRLFVSPRQIVTISQC